MNLKKIEMLFLKLYLFIKEHPQILLAVIPIAFKNELEYDNELIRCAHYFIFLEQFDYSLSRNEILNNAKIYLCEVPKSKAVSPNGTTYTLIDKAPFDLIFKKLEEKQ